MSGEGREFRTEEDRARRKHPEKDDSNLGRQMRNTEEQPMGAIASAGVGSRTESLIRTCQSCAHYTGESGEHGGKCTVGQLTNPVTGNKHGGRPSEPRHWQIATELRTAPYTLTTCGEFGRQWEAIY